LELVLPKLLLLCLVQEREVANMVYEYVAEEREVRVFGGDLACIRLERRAESLEGGRVGQLGDFELGLLGYEFAFKVCDEVRLAFSVVYMGHGFAGRLTMLLLARQDGTLGWNRHHGELGVGRVVARGLGTVLGGIGLSHFSDSGLAVHDGAAIDLDLGGGHCEELKIGIVWAGRGRAAATG
jgi:hypothetical protein